MSIGVLACESMVDYVRAAQKRLNTAYPVFVLHYGSTENPVQMQLHITQATAQMPEEIDTLLVAMGFCGGSWNQVTAERRMVIPRVDDCVSILLNDGRRHRPNPKKMGHLYVTEWQPQSTCKRLCQQCPRWKADANYPRWFANHSRMDIVDTGTFDCYSEDYVEEAQRCADSMNCTLGYVSGSNLLMEKLIGGQWDDQFIVAEPGQRISHKDFFQE